VATVRKRGRAWQATVRGPDGRERTKTWAKKVDAERWASTQEADKARGQWIDPRAGSVTFGDYAKAWAASQVWRPGTERSVSIRLEKHILPTLGDVPIGALRTSLLQAWVKDRSEELAPSTLQLLVRILRSVLRAAVADRVIAINPADGLKLPRIERPKIVPLTVEQVIAMRDAMPARYSAAVVIAAGAGLRPGELFGLTVDRVDWLRRTITVDRQLVTLKGTRLAPPKTTSSVRAIPVPEVVLQALSAHVGTYHPGPDGVIFTPNRDTHVSASSAGHVWRRSAGRAGLPRDADGWHALRHFYASVLIRAGESVKVVQERLGHASAAITLDTYTHLWPSDEDRTRSAVATALENLADMPRTEAHA
jgi:integrase